MSSNVFDFAAQIRAMNERHFDLEQDPPRCRTHPGVTVDTASEVLRCPACAAEAQRRRQHAEAEYAYEAALERWQKRLATVPRWPWADFSSPTWLGDIEPQVAKAWADWDGLSPMAIMAPTGSGKTSGFTAWVRRQDRRLRSERDAGLALPFVYVSHVDLTAAVRNHPLGKDDPPELKRALATPMLVIDEVGAASTDVGLLLRVLDHRYRLGRPHVALTGHPMAGLLGILGDALVRRLIGNMRRVDVFKGGR